MRLVNLYLFLIVFAIVGQAQKGEVMVDISSLDWVADMNRTQAGAILVPENHDAPNEKKIQISYVIIKKKDTSANKYPIIYFSGGPGGNTINKGFINYLLGQPMSVQRDVILFDQRGIGYSSALPDMSFKAFDIMAKDADSEEELALTRAMILEYKEKCKQQGINPAYYNTIQNARDVGMLFKHLGYKKYNLLGGSYGTRLGRVVQDMFPEFIHTSVLDSPAPLSGDFLLNRLESYALSLGRILEYCENDVNCKKQYPDLKGDYFKALAALEKNPLRATMNDSIKVYINAQDGVYLLRRLLYQSNAREKAPELIRAYLEGGGDVIGEVLKFEYQLTGGLNLSMLLSVEKFENFNPANTPQVIREHYKKYPLIPVKLGFFDAFYQAGMDWHNNNLPLEKRKFKDSEIPTLLFVNQFDPVTPPKNGYLFKENLKNATLLILDEGGHGGGNPQCKSEVIINFMDAPERPVDTTCLNLYKK